MKHLVLSAAVTICLAGYSLVQDPVWDSNTVALESQKPADGIFAVIPTGANDLAAAGFPIAATGGFVMGETGVLVVE